MYFYVNVEMNAVINSNVLSKTSLIYKYKNNIKLQKYYIYYV